jgi:hypothetical protein
VIDIGESQAIAMHKSLAMAMVKTSEAMGKGENDG